MTEVDFYLLAQQSAHHAVHLTACRIAEKAHTRGQHVHLYTDSPAACQTLDTLLWTFHDLAFIPHELGPPTDPDCPVTLGHTWAPPQGEVLITLTTQAPAFAGRFARVIEIIAPDEPSRTQARGRYRHYKAQGFILRHHEL